MTPNRFTRLAALLLATNALALPALADEPGPGGSRPVISKTGEEVFKNVCAACHMQDAKGGTGAATIPALASNPLLATPEYPITLVLKGRGAMPSFVGTLDNEQIAGAVTYVRTHFGNTYKTPVTAADVAALAK